MPPSLSLRRRACFPLTLATASPQRPLPSFPAQEGVLAGGVLTPASAFGEVLVRRLRRAGYSVIVRESHGITI